MALGVARFFYVPALVIVPPSILGTPSIINFSTTVDPQSSAYTLVAGANGLIAIAYIDTNSDFTSVTWTATGASAQVMTALTFRELNDCQVRGFYLSNPNVGSAAGAGTISLDLTLANPCALLPISIAGWNGTAPIENGHVAGSITDPVPLAIDPEPNSLIIHAANGSTIGQTMTFDGAETVLVNTDTANNTLHAGASWKQSVSGAATTVDLSLAISSTRYVATAIALAA